MNTIQKYRHQMVWLPEPIKKPEVEIPYQEGKILPNSPEEEIELPMLRVTYTEKQLRKMKRRNNKLKFKKRNQQRVLLKEQLYEEVLYD